MPIPLWDAQGKKVVREEIVRPAADSECGILLDLKKAIHVFRTPDDTAYAHQNWEDPPPPRKVRMSVYPLASLHGQGNVQFTGASPAVAKFVADMNRRLLFEVEEGQALRDENPDIPTKDITVPSGTIPAVEAINTQIYHTIAHSIRESTGLNQATRGLVTALATGTYWTSKRPDWDRAQRTKNMLGTVTLPHRILQSQVEAENAPNVSRQEILYTIIMSRLPNRGGRYVTLSGLFAFGNRMI